MSRIPVLRFRSILPVGGCYHMARTAFSRGGVRQVHRHDFAEVFFVESGRGVHTVNGRSAPLAAGDVVLVRPADAHGLSGVPAEERRGGRPFTIVNVAFEAAELSWLRRRYYAAGGFPWDSGVMPAQVRIGPAALRRLSRWAERLAAMDQRRLLLDGFLVALVDVIEQAGGTAPRPLAAASSHAGSSTAVPADCPGWLANALSRLVADAEALADGLPALVALAGRSPEHVNRTVRRCFGATATDLVNRLRLDAAARLLRVSDRPILGIALDCGFANLGYFYRRFTARFGQTPRAHRRAQRAVFEV